MSRQGVRPKLDDATLRAIVGEIQNQAEKPPPGFKTHKEWATLWKLKKTATSRYLAAGVANGILEIRMVRLNLGVYVRRVPHWGPKTGSKRRKLK